MEKRGSPKQEDTSDLLKPEADNQPKGKTKSRFVVAGKLFGIIKFILGVCLLPFVYSVSFSFLNEFSVIEKSLQHYFWGGLVSFIAIYLFIWEPAKLYVKGQKLLELIFSFFRPLVKVAPYLLPIYTIELFVLYAILYAIFKSQSLDDYFIFLFGFSISLHLVFGAKSLRSKQGDFLKANYIFGFSFVYILNVTLLAFFLNVMFKDYSIVNFVNNSFQTGKGIFDAIFKQLFL